MYCSSDVIDHDLINQVSSKCLFYGNGGPKNSGYTIDQQAPESARRGLGPLSFGTCSHLRHLPSAIRHMILRPPLRPLPRTLSLKPTRTRHQSVSILPPVSLF